MFRLIKSLIVILVFTNHLEAQITTVKAEFERKIIQKNRTEKVKGIIYYKFNHKIVIKVKEPVKQIMIIEKNKLILYYPLQRQAFYITQKNEFDILFFKSFLGGIKEDFGLSEIGYTLLKEERKNDILYTYWKPPNKLSKRLGIFKLGIKSNKIVYAAQKKSDGSILTQVAFSKHIKYKNYYFPLEIYAEKYDKKEKIIEEIIFKDPEFNKQIPEEIINFKIPPETKIEKIRW